MVGATPLGVSVGFNVTGDMLLGVTVWTVLSVSLKVAPGINSIIVCCGSVVDTTPAKKVSICLCSSASQG